MLMNVSFKSHRAIQIVDNLLVSKSLACGDAKPGTDTLHFLDETVLQHLLGTDVDAAVKFLTRKSRPICTVGITYR